MGTKDQLPGEDAEQQKARTLSLNPGAEKNRLSAECLISGLSFNYWLHFNREIFLFYKDIVVILLSLIYLDESIPLDLPP